MSLLSVNNYAMLSFGFVYRFSMNKDLYRLQVTEFCIHRINFHCEHNIQRYNVSLHGKFIYRLEKSTHFKLFYTVNLAND